MLIVINNRLRGPSPCLLSYTMLECLLIQNWLAPGLWCIQMRYSQNLLRLCSRKSAYISSGQRYLSPSVWCEWAWLVCVGVVYYYFNRYHSCVDAFVSKDFKEENYLVYYIPSLLQARILSLDKWVYFYSIVMSFLFLSLIRLLLGDGDGLYSTDVTVISNVSGVISLVNISLMLILTTTGSLELYTGNNKVIMWTCKYYSLPLPLSPSRFPLLTCLHCVTVSVCCQGTSLSLS